MVVIVEGFVLIILSDITKEHVSNCLIKIMKKDLSSSIWNDFVLMLFSVLLLLTNPKLAQYMRFGSIL